MYLLVLRLSNSIFIVLSCCFSRDLICCYAGTHDGKYSLVSFHDEDSIAVVPSKKIMFTNDMQGNVVNVLWDDKRQYAATLLMTGNINM